MRELKASTLALKCAEERLRQAEETVRRLRRADTGADTLTVTWTDDVDAGTPSTTIPRQREQLHLPSTLFVCGTCLGVFFLLLFHMSFFLQSIVLP